MKLLLDGDILRYEIGFAAEVGWKHIVEDEEELPPWDYVKDILHQRINYIEEECKADGWELYLTEGPTFREEIAVTKPYKGTRPDSKPWHFNNLSVYMKDVLGAKVVTGIEADDALTIDHLKDKETILCSRDKDLRQVPGWFYSWELGAQPSFGPVEISKVGSLELSETSKPKKLIGTGFAFFCAQVLMGDPVDNIPGLSKCGPVAAYNILHQVLEGGGDEDQQCIDLFELTADAYSGTYGPGWDEHLLEQGRLVWMIRKLHEDGSPVLWELGMTE